MGGSKMNDTLTVQVGQMIQFTDPLTLNTALGGQAITLPAGTQSLVTKSGFAYVVRPASFAGKMVKLDDSIVVKDEIDIQSIAKEIARRLAKDFEFDEDERQEATDTIELVLDDVFF
jgi:hypothetical protein